MVNFEIETWEVAEPISSPSVSTSIISDSTRARSADVNRRDSLTEIDPDVSLHSILPTQHPWTSLNVLFNIVRFLVSVWLHPRDGAINL